MTNKGIYKSVDMFLQRLDAAPIGGGTIFKDDTAKQWMETSVHRAVGKLEAATYHARNVARLVNKANRGANDRPPCRVPGVGPGVTDGTARVTSTFSLQEIAYEVDAFLAASRASIDFSASIVALHLGMARRTGVTEVLKWIENTRNPSLIFVLERKAWIEHLKAYRDECVHYRTLRAQMGYEAVRSEGTTAEAAVPLAIPEAISRTDDRPDTRARRAFESDLGDELLPEGLSKFETSGSIKAQDGTILSSDHSIGYAPVPGYVLAEKFCSSHLDQLIEFTERLFEEVPRLGFALQRRASASRHGGPR